MLTKIFMLCASTNNQVKRESLYVITNILSTYQNKSSIYNLSIYEDCKLISLFVGGLKINDAQIIIEILQALTVILDLDKSCNLTDS
jgi:hypothetical protein